MGAKSNFSIGRARDCRERDGQDHGFGPPAEVLGWTLLKGPAFDHDRYLSTGRRVCHSRNCGSLYPCCEDGEVLIDARGERVIAKSK